MGKIKELEEGRRPVSGDRRIAVAIEGLESFVVNDANLSVADDGFMVVSSEGLSVADEGESNKSELDYKVRLVVVVGLLHANGVIDLLSDAIKGVAFRNKQDE